MNLPDLNASQLLPGAERTDLVTTLVKVNGAPIPDTILPNSIQVTRLANRIPFALLTFFDGDVAQQRFPVSDRDLFSPGNTIEIHAGYHGTNALIFKGIIIRHALRIRQNETPHIEVECKDEAVKMTVGRKNKYFYNQTDSGILQEILRSRSLQNQVETTQVNHAEMVQFNATDWDFIVTRAEANGQLVLVKNGAVKIAKPDFTQASKFTLHFGVSIFELEAEMDARDQYPTAKSSIWDAGNQAVQENQPSGGGGLSGFSPPAVPAAVGGAVQTVGSAAGLDLPGSPPNLDYTKVLGLAHLPLQHGGGLTAPEAQEWAKAQMTKSQLATKRGRVKFEGMADIHPGEVIRLEGVGARHTGNVFVTGITHEISEGTWYTHAQFGLTQQWMMQEFSDVQEVPAAALLPAVHGLQVGVVSGLAGDPDNAHRVQVRLPLVDNRGQGMWARMASQDAGDNRGAFWRPEVGDEVVVEFSNDDPREAVIIGMMNSSAKPAPLTTTDDNHQKGWVTRSKMKWIFDDQKKSMTLETPGGKKIIVDEDADKIHLEDEHGNKITMNAKGITIESAANLVLKAKQDLTIDAVNVTQKASANFKAEGQAQAQLTASGDVVVKGAFVRIN